jgi:hypothetical protein
MSRGKGNTSGLRRVDADFPQFVGKDKGKGKGKGKLHAFTSTEAL